MTRKSDIKSGGVISTETTISTKYESFRAFASRVGFTIPSRVRNMTARGISNKNPNGNVRFSIKVKYLSAVNTMSKWPADNCVKNPSTIGNSTKYPKEIPIINKTESPECKAKRRGVQTGSKPAP